MRRLLLILPLLSLCLILSAQSNSTYSFLDLPAGSHNAALGGQAITIFDNDLSLAFDNPAHLSDSTHNDLTFSYANWFRDVNLGSVIYGRNLDDKNYFACGIRYVDYGKFDGRTETDVSTGTFYAKDIVAEGIYSRWLSPHWSCGVGVKAVYSVYEKYQSVGMAFDIGFSYHYLEKGLTLALVCRDAGFQFKGYYSVEGSQKYEALPVNLMFGLSYKIPKIPIRLAFTYHNIQRWDLSYSTSDAVTDALEEMSKAEQGVDMFFRHTIWSLEVIPTNYLYFVVAYNHRTHQDMALASKRSAAGFCFGAGFSVKQFALGFSILPYQGGNVGFNIDFTVDLAGFGIK